VTRPEQPQPLTLAESIIPVAGLIVLVALSYFLFGDAGANGPNQVALVVATMIAVFIGWRRGHTLESLREAAIAGVKLRRIHGGNAGRSHLELRVLCSFLLREPAAGRWHGVRRNSDETHHHGTE
jgi:hypothetical protein